MMHTFDFEAIDIRETKNVPYTFSHICEKDWEICSFEFLENYSCRMLESCSQNGVELATSKKC